MVQISVAGLLAIAGCANAWGSPWYDGFNRLWEETFPGASGQLPNEGNWNILQGDLGVNNELQVYQRNSRNVQVSGGDTLQLVPWRDGAQPKGWTSGRIESKYTFTPQAGRLTRVEAQLRFGESATGNKQGIWPAWWMLGDGIRNGVPWPACGEIDILETVNGILTGHSTIHCDVYPGGICNEGQGIGASTGIPDMGWHTWRAEIDRRPGNWVDQSITFYRDGARHHTVTGARIGNANVCNALPILSTQG